MKESFKRHRRFYNFMKPFLYLFLKIKFNFVRPEPKDISGPYVVISNHVTYFDMFLVPFLFKEHMYFVAGEQIMRAGLLSKLLEFFLDPIIRPKATVGASTVIKMKKRIKKGYNICLFAEGEQNACGVNRKIIKSTAAVIKMLGCKLVTVKIHGGFFTSPRWSRTDRRGEVSCEVINEYSAESLKTMTEDELDRLINSDIFEDAYEYNAARKIPYKGKKLAENIEFELIMCPNCNRTNTIKSRGNEFFCDCGMRGRYDEFGFISGSGFSFHTITEWDKWETQQIKALPDVEDDTVLASNEDQLLFTLSGDHSSVLTSSGTLTLTNKALSVGNLSIALDNISKIDQIMHGYLLVSTKDGKYYEIKNKKKKFSGYLYILLIDRYAPEKCTNL